MVYAERWSQGILEKFNSRADCFHVEEKINISENDLEMYGKYKAKINITNINNNQKLLLILIYFTSFCADCQVIFLCRKYIFSSFVGTLYI